MDSRTFQRKGGLFGSTTDPTRTTRFLEPLDAGLEPLADGTPSSPSTRPDPSEMTFGRAAPGSRAARLSADNRFPPSQRVDLAAFTPNDKLGWTLADPASRNVPPAPLKAANADSTSMNLLEDIWDHLEEPASEPKPTAIPEPPTNAAEIESPSLANQKTSTLLNRAPGSAIEHLRKATATRRDVLASTRLTQWKPLRCPALHRWSNPPHHNGRACSSPPRVHHRLDPYPRVQSRLTGRTSCWPHSLPGLSGAGLFAYEYYQNVREQNRQEAVALQQREQEETDRHAQEAAQQRKAEIARYLEQARQAMANRNWSLADNFLNQATTIDPNHPAVVAARSELLAAQRPGKDNPDRQHHGHGTTLGRWRLLRHGQPANERDRGSDESSHQVCVKGFWIGNTEVTNNQYRRFKTRP